MGRPPIAYTSLSELAAAMAPKVKGSSTIGVKKSTVCTSARLSVSLYTPASSLVSKPTSTFSFGTRGKLASTWSKTFGLSLDAQPAAFTCAVNFAPTLPPSHLIIGEVRRTCANFPRIDARFVIRRCGGAGVPGAAGRPPHEERVPPRQRERVDLRAPGRRSGRNRLPARIPAGAGNSRRPAGHRAGAGAGHQAKLEVFPRGRQERALAAH